MKKTVSIVLGLMLLMGAVVPFSEASRDAYHVYLTSPQNMKYLRSSRYFTDRQGDARRFLRSRSYANKNTKKRVKNLRYPSGNKRYLYSGPERRTTNRSVRPSTQGKISSWENKLYRKTTTKSALSKRNMVFETYENEAFSVQLPKGWFDQNKKTHEFVSPEYDYKVSVKKFEDEPCKEITGFTACVIALAKNENREALEGQGKILTTSRIIRQSQYLDTVLNELTVRTATYTESFSAQFGDEERYVSRYFVQDLDGGIYLIETQTSPEKARKYVEITKQVFYSFRIYPNK